MLEFYGHEHLSSFCAEENYTATRDARPLEWARKRFRRKKTPVSELPIILPTLLTVSR